MAERYEVAVIVNGRDYYCVPWPAPDAPEPEPEPEPQPARVIAFSQRDERWEKIHLGGSAYTMGGAGCAVTAATMIATQIDPTLTPGDVAQWLNGHGGFTSDGLLYWSKAAEAVPGMEFVSYTLWRKTRADLDVLFDALAKGPVVIQVDFRPKTTALDTHFVVAESYTADRLDLNIIDPWTGARGTLLSLYAEDDWDLARAVYALCVYDVARG